MNAQEADTGIEFDHSAWKEILAKAKSSNKIIMLDAYTSWCGPCKWMAKNVFTQPEVATYYNSTFVNAKIDMEKGEGIELAKKYGVQAYPTFLYINGDGELIHRVCGGMEGADFITQGKTALDNTANYFSVRKKFKDNPKDNAIQFFEAADRACENASVELETYLKLLTKEEVSSPANFRLLYNTITAFSDPAFPFLYSNYAVFASKYGNDTLDKKLMPIYENALNRAGSKNDFKKVEELKTSYAIIKDVKLKDYLNDVAAVASIDKNKNPDKYYATLATMVDKHFMNDANALNHFSWDFYEKVSDKKLLERARVWSAKAAAISNDYATNDTYAAVLYKLGMKAEAKKVAETAIDLAKKNGEDSKETEELLKKIDQLK